MFAAFSRRLLLIAADALLLPLAVWLSFWLRLAHPLHTSFLAKLAGGCCRLFGLLLFLSTPLAVITRYHRAMWVAVHFM